MRGLKVLRSTTPCFPNRFFLETFHPPPRFFHSDVYPRSDLMEDCQRRSQMQVDSKPEELDSSTWK